VVSICRGGADNCTDDTGDQQLHGQVIRHGNSSRIFFFESVREHSPCVSARSGEVAASRGRAECSLSPLTIRALMFVSQPLGARLLQ
jgi:hypothetical protein